MRWLMLKRKPKVDSMNAGGRTEEGIGALLSIAEIHEREIGSLGDKIASISETVAQVSENGRATDERLNALINIVERQISEGRNGKS